MSTSQDDFNKSIASTMIKTSLLPIISNITAKPIQDTHDIKNDLQNQLTHRVRWTESIKFLISEGISEFIEIGSGSVLSGLIKRIDHNVIATPLGAPVDFQHFEGS
jgi:[acyl-carrier-protein] S-malonyltransferase